MSEGFLSRWSRLKRDREQAPPRNDEQAPPRNEEDASATVPPDARPKSEVPAAPPGDVVQEHAAAGQPRDGPDVAAGSGSPRDPEESLPPIASLTPQSDFTPFLRRGVTPQTRNAALKKLFADPHYNVMDGLDVYIEDYNITVPIPEQTLARLVRDHASGFAEAAGDWIADTDPGAPRQCQSAAPPEVQMAQAAEAAQVAQVAQVAQAAPQGDDAIPQPELQNPGGNIALVAGRSTGSHEPHPGEPDALPPVNRNEPGAGVSSQGSDPEMA